MDDMQKNTEQDIQAALPLDFSTPLTAKPAHSAGGGHNATNAALAMAEQLADEGGNQNEKQSAAKVEAEVDDLPSLAELEAERRKREEANHAAGSLLANEGMINMGISKPFEPEKTPAEEVKNISADDENSTPPGEPPKVEIKRPVKTTVFNIKKLVPPDYTANPKTENISTGAYLKSVRDDLKLDLRQVEEESRIAIRYLVSLESDDMRKMPPAVYVIAYIRKLGALYHIDIESQEMMCAELRKMLSYEIPDALVERVELDTEYSDENEKQIKRWLLRILIGVGGLALAGILLGVWLYSAGSQTPKTGSVAGENVGNVELDDAKILSLLPAPTLKINELPAKN